MPANVARCVAMAVRCQAEDGRGRRRPPGRSPRCGGPRSRAGPSIGPASGSRPCELQGRALRVARGHPAEQRRGRAVRGRKSLGDRAGVATQPLWRLVDQRVGAGSCRASRQAGRGRPRRRGRRRWRRPSRHAAPGAATTRRSPRPPPGRRRRPDGPTRRWSGSPARDGRHRSCRRTRRPRRRTRRHSPIEPWPAGRR